MKLDQPHILILLALAGIAFLIYFYRCKCKERFTKSGSGKVGVAPGGACQPEMEECWSGFDCINGTCQQTGGNDCSVDGTCASNPGSKERYTQNNEEMCLNGCYTLYEKKVYQASEDCNKQFPNDPAQAQQCFENSPGRMAAKNCGDSCASGCN